MRRLPSATLLLRGVGMRPGEKGQFRVGRAVDQLTGTVLRSVVHGHAAASPQQRPEHSQAQTSRLIVTGNNQAEYLRYL